MGSLYHDQFSITTIYKLTWLRDKECREKTGESSNSRLGELFRRSNYVCNQKVEAGSSNIFIFFQNFVKINMSIFGKLIGEK